MTRDIQITITPETIEDWKNELSKINGKIKWLLERRDKLQARLHYLDLYLEDPRQASLPGLPEKPDESPPRSESDPTTPNQSIKQMSPPEAIRKVLHEAERPLKKNEIRGRLKLAGYPMEKYRHDGGYFHTIISRMQRSGEVTFEGEKLVIKK